MAEFDRFEADMGNGKKKGESKSERFPDRSETESSQDRERHREDLALILDIPLEITIELGRSRMLINDLLKLKRGSVIELPKSAGETLDVLANNQLIARGEVVVVKDHYGIRISEIITPRERIETLG